MANTLCSFLPFPRVAYLPCIRDCEEEEWTLLRVLLFCKRFSKVEAPDEIRLGACHSSSPYIPSNKVRHLASLPNLKCLDCSVGFLDVESVHKLFRILSDFACLTKLALPDVPEMTDWEIVAEALRTSESLERVGCFLLGERGEGWARALDAGLCADTPLSSADLRIPGPMSETALQALENLLLNKSLSSVSIIVEGDMPNSLAVTLARCLTGQTVVKSLELRVNGKLSFSCANLMEGGIVKNTSLSNLVVSLHGELPDNWRAIVENLNVRLAEKSTVTFAIHPSTLSQVTAIQVTTFFRPYFIGDKEPAQRSFTLNLWGEITVDAAEALYNLSLCTWVSHLTLNILGKLTNEFLHCTARHVDKQKPLCPITINTWGQLTDDGKALLEELELDKNPALNLNVCDLQEPLD
ncbi:PREDICTED: uncharacterized protein LOC107354145 [Acropora digitifera]|uniref:uncharacterized protein LOC107354145 n=1 Tax=Acropora digitifera TaxID=70779 RepID=UPI00077A93F4|nr:PREDICTED: uncharacterized protein LOC107354145 [Acropora digitifera]